MSNYPGLVVNYKTETGILSWVGGLNSPLAKALIPDSENIYDLRAKIMRKDKKHIASLIEKASNNGSDWNFEYRIRINNKTIWLREQSQSIVSDKNNLTTLFIQDITKTKKKNLHLEKVLGKAAEKVSLKNDFVSSMSHEIRTPMNAVMGMAQILSKTPLNAEQKRYISTITDSSFALVQVINDMLDVSKYEAGTIELSSVRINLEKLCLDICDELSEKSIEKQTRLYLDFDAMDSRIAQSDKERLTQLITNLITNAIKYTNTGFAKLHVEILKKTKTKTDYKFSVIDTGIGIPKKFIPKMFGAFSQADSEYTKTFGGTGLGLQICNHIVSLMKGKIKLESEVNVGSTFSFEICLKNTSSDSTNTLTIDNTRCLLVHHDEQDIDQITRTLKSTGISTEILTDSEDALSTVIAKPTFDIMLIAKDMPGLSGIQLTELIRKNPAYETVPIVIITKSTDNTNSSELAKSYINTFFTTPCSPSLIMNAISHALEFKDKKPAATHITNDSILESDDDSAKTIRTTGSALVVDDIEVNRLVLNSFLSQIGLSIEFAVNGKEAVEKVQANEFDIVFMDCRMPVMNGYDATAAIRKLDSDQSEVPIVALTANANDEDRKECLDAGMDDFMTKPFAEETLHGIIRKWLTVTEIQNNEIQENVIEETDDEDFFDSVQFDKLQQTMGEKFADFALGMSEKFSGYRETIKQHLQEGDLEASREKAHSLKGLSGLIGAKGVAAQAYVIELASKDRNIEQINVGLSKLANDINQTKDIIDEKVKPELDDTIVLF